MNIRILSLLVLIIAFMAKGFSQSAFYNMGRSYAEEENYDEAIRLTKLAIEMDSNDSFNLISDYCALSEYYSYKNCPDSCKWFSDKAIKLSLKEDRENYKSVIRWLSHSLFRAGFHKEGLNMRNEIFKLTEEEFGSESPLLVQELRILSSFSISAGEIKNAIDYAKKEEELSYKHINLSDEDYNDNIPYDESFGWMRTVLQNYDDPKSGIYYILDCLDRHRDAINDDIRRETLTSIWAISRNNDFIEGCLAVYKEEALHSSIPEKFKSLTNIFAEDKNIEYDIHAPEYAQELFDLAINDDLSLYFTVEDIKDLLDLLQNYYNKIGRIKESIQIGKKNIEWLKQNNYDLNGSEASVLIFASNSDENADYAISLGKEILESHMYDNYPDIMTHIYESMAEAYRRIGDVKNQNKYLEKLSENKNFDSLFALASINLKSRNLKDLLDISCRLANYRDIPREKRDLIISWIMISARHERNDSLLLCYIREYLDIYRDYILNNIPSMSEEEQVEFFRSGTYNSYSLFPDYAMGINNNTFEWVSPKEAYDYALLSKSILLTSQNEFRNLIKNSADQTIIDKWTRLQQQDNAFSLQSEILKRDLINYASQNSNYLKQLSYGWEDVRKALKDDEVAIEFLICDNFHTFDSMNFDPSYVALLISKKFPEPIPIILTSNIRLDIIREHNGIENLDNNISYSIIWYLIEPFLEGIKTIYFSPIELLNIIPIEYALIGPEVRACDKWNLVRVTSTREIISRHRMNKKENAILYGGLKYNLDKDELIYQSRKGNYHPTSALRAVEMENLRYGVKDLPGSLIEVKEIAKYFPTSPQVITGVSGTEESFKALASSSLDIIHLATHGFFWNVEDVEKRDYVNFLNTDGKVLTKEENAMLRSGLIFSGANIGLTGEPLPDDVEDGVLTALELSNLNLGNVDLVVMSACESGLGEISSDGVFGLQRGFKLAGTNSLLMSLWKVDDDATQKLMTEFYKNYLGGMSKQESLHHAQMVLRNDPKYSDPEYWSAFILLDALN